MHINSAAFGGKVVELVVMDQLWTILGKANYFSVRLRAQVLNGANTGCPLR